MDGELELGSGTVTDSGAGEEQVSSSFDVSKAMDSISSSLFDNEAVEPQAQKAPAPAPAPAAPAAPEVKEPAAEPEKVVAAEVPAGAPKTWKPEVAAQWAAIPPAVQAEITRREEDMFQGIERYKATASFGNTVQEVLKPYDAIMKAHNIDPVQTIQGLLGVEYKMATGTHAQRLEVLREIATNYKIDLGAVAGGGQEEDPYAAPENARVAQLERELAEVKSGQTSLQAARYEEARQQKQSEVNAFATDPANPHFNEVAEDMARMLGLDKSLSLAKAYEQAVWSNPVTRAKEIARQDAEKQASARADAEKKLAEAKKAQAVNVQVKPKAGAATLPLGSMDDTLAQTLALVKNR